MKYNIGLLSKYVTEYESVIPKSVIIGISLLTCGGVAVTYLAKSENPTLVKKISWGMFLVYLGMTLCLTLVFRESRDVARLSLKSMWCLESLNYKLIVEAILNFLFFIPIGFLASASLREKNDIIVLGIGFGLSLAIEITQYITKRGVCNIDDVILNTAGCAVGYGLFLLYYRLTKVTHKIPRLV